MRLSHLLLAALLVAAGLPPASAADLSKIDRTLKDEPKYTTRAPKYCLLVFGAEAKTLVWLVHDGDVLHVRASLDGKAAPIWRQFKNVRYGAPIGDVCEAGGKVRHKHLRYSPGQTDMLLTVDVEGKRQSAGHDRSGPLQFAATSKAAPIVHFNGPPSLGLWYEQEPLRSDREVQLTAVVGTPGVGKGTFAYYSTRCYPRGAWPTAVIEYPPKEKGGKPIVATVRLAED
jgi:hypothetical protein